MNTVAIQLLLSAFALRDVAGHVIARSATSSASSSTVTPIKNTGKRGLAYNNPEYTNFFSLSGQNSEVSWCYNWNYDEPKPAELNPAVEYIPLLYNANPDLLKVWPAAAQAAINNGSTALMSFNEPDFAYSGSGSNYMDIDLAVETWMKYMEPFAGKATLVAPAVTNVGAPSGLTWLENFIGNCTNCTIDAINIHWYSNKWAGAAYLESHTQDARAIADGRPIWISEFGLDDSDGTYTDADLLAFLDTALPWLDAQEDVHRYAYFMDTTGYLLNSAGTAMSDSGVLYNNYTGASTTASATSTSASSTSTSSLYTTSSVFSSPTSTRTTSVSSTTASSSSVKTTSTSPSSPSSTSTTLISTSTSASKASVTSTSASSTASIKSTTSTVPSSSSTSLSFTATSSHSTTAVSSTSLASSSKPTTSATSTKSTSISKSSSSLTSTSSASTPTFSVVSAYFATTNLSLSTPQTFLSGPNLVFNTSKSALLALIPGQTDPWSGVLKTLSVLYTFNHTTYIFAAKENTGVYTLTPSSPGIAAVAGVNSGVANAVPVASGVSVPSGSPITIVGVAWGAGSVNTGSVWTRLYNQAMTNWGFQVEDGVFGVDTMFGTAKTCVIWYRKADGLLRALVGEEGWWVQF